MPDLVIDAKELVQLTLDLCNIESPAGHEAEVGEFVYTWMEREGLAPRRSECFQIGLMCWARCQAAETATA
jgi:hypothetical protein